MSITLHALVARSTPLEWFESVAVVQELAAAVIKEGASENRVPDLPGAEVNPDGTVHVIDPGAGRQAPVFRLAHVLSALLPPGGTPVPLRLLVLTALSPESTYKTVLELSQALEYFERPDRRALVREVYERALRLPAVEVAVAPLPERPEPPKPAPQPKKRRTLRLRRQHLAIAAAVVLVSAMAAGAWWVTRPSGSRALASTTTSVAKAVAAAVDTIRSGLGRPAPAKATAAPAATPAPAKDERRRPRPVRPDRSLAQDGLAPAAKVAPPTAGDAPTTPLKVDEVIWLSPPPDGATGVPTAYSAADRNVRPPVAIRPRLPTEPPPGVPLDALTRIEVLVSASGEVESVKIVSGPRTALDGMMLSAVKTWQFQPATKDGQPVAYRHLVWLTNTFAR